MSKEFPEYEQKNIVQPATEPKMGEIAKPASMSEAFASVGKSYEGLANFGSQLAQNASNQVAQEKAIEAAQNPGRSLWPEFTRADQEFTKSYKQEEAQVLSYRGSQALRKIYEEVAKDPNPTGASLQKYEKASKDIISDILNNANSSVRHELKRSLESTFEGNFYNLSHKVEDANRKYIKQESAAQAVSTQENMVSAVRDGRFDAGQEAYNERIRQIENEASREGWDKQTLDNAIQSETELYSGAMGQYEYLKKPEGEKDEFQASIRKDPDKHEFLKGMNKVQQDRVIDGIQKFGNNYQSAFQGQRSIDFIKYSNAIENKSFTADMIEEAREKLSGVQFAKLSQLQNKINRKESINLENHRYISSIAANVDQVNEEDPKKINAAAKIELNNYSNAKKIATGDGNLSLSEQVEVLTNWKAPIPFLQKSLNETAKGGSIEKKMDAAKAIDYAQMKNPNLISGVSKDALDFADSFKNRKSSGESDDNAIINAHKEVYEVDEKELKRRDLQWENITSDKSSKYNFKDIDKRDSFVAKQISGASFWSSKKNLAITPDFVESYMENLRRNFTGDMDTAVERTTRAFDRSNGETNIDGFDHAKYTHAPIEKYLPPDRKVEGMRFVKSQMIDKTKEMCAAYKELFDRREKGIEGGIDYYYEIRPSRSATTLNEIKVKQVWRSGEVIKGYMSFDADKFTTAGNMTRMPSYGVKFKSNKSANGQDLLNPKTMTLGDYIRYTPDLTEFHKPVIEKEQKEEKGLKKEAHRIKAQNIEISGRFKEYHDNIQQYQDLYGDDLWN